MSDRASRTRGALLGLAAGDALGLPTDRRSPDDVRRALAGNATPTVGKSETAVELTLAASMAYAGGAFDLHAAARAMLDWLASAEREVGACTRRALESIARGDATPHDAGEKALRDAPGAAAGNGSLMRAAPPGLVRGSNDPRLAREAAQLSRVTHADPRAVAACVAFASVLAAVIDGEGPREALTRARAVTAQSEGGRAVARLIDDLLHGRPVESNAAAPPSFVLVCLARALTALRDARSFEEGLSAVLELGGDSDTNASAAGALLGARFGEAAVPARWRSAIRGSDRILDAATRCLAFRESASRYRRPRRSTTTTVYDRADLRDPTAMRRGFEEDGFVIVRDLFASDAVSRARERVGPIFAGEWETGIPPEHVQWRAGWDPADVTREIRGVFRSDRAIARLVLDAELGRIAAALGGWPGARINQAGLLWKPAYGRAVGAHQDASFIDWVVPTELVTAWIALDDTASDGGTLEYVRGSHRFGLERRVVDFDGPDDPYEELYARLGARAAELEVTEVIVPAGGVAFHHGGLWHGSSSNRTPRDRRAIGVHLMSSEARFHPTAPAKTFARYRHLDDLEMDESFFPITWSRAGTRTRGLDAFVSPER